MSLRRPTKNQPKWWAVEDSSRPTLKKAMAVHQHNEPGDQKATRLAGTDETALNGGRSHSVEGTLHLAASRAKEGGGFHSKIASRRGWRGRHR